MPTQPSPGGATRRRPLRRAVLGVAAVLALTTAGVLAAAPADAATAPHLAVHVVRHGSSAAPHVVITGRLTAGRGGLAGRTVQVQARTSGTSRWHTLRRAVTRRDGSVVVKPAALRRAEDFRVRYAGAVGAVTSPTASVPITTAATVTATSNPTPVAGDPVALSGTTTANLTGARIFLQLLRGGTWQSVSSSVVTGDATWTVRAVATQGGEPQYRALVPASAGRPQAVSGTRSFTVSAWYRLADLTAVAGDSAITTLTAGRQVVAGTPYLQALGASLQEGATATATYALGGRCSAFRTTYGPTSDSDPGFYGVFRARADDDVVVDATLDRGSVQTTTVDITGASALRLDSSALTGDGDAAWGNPEVLCAGR